MIEAFAGLLVIDKPSGPTSHDIVARVRRSLGGVKVGHAGTLDPFATGVLPLVIGRATRLVRFLATSPKLYVGEIEFGLTTSSDDITGTVIGRHDGSPPEPPRVAAAASTFLGRSMQAPPIVSARHVDGERSYRRARRGEAIAPRPSEIEVFRFDVLPTPEPRIWRFEAEVSGGTYVRALARDLGAALGCGGILRSLRRTAAGPLTDATALALGEDGVRTDRRVLADAIVPMARMPLDPPPCRIEAPDAARFVAGSRVPAPRDAPVAGPVSVFRGEALLLGVGVIESGSLVPRVVVATATALDSLPGSTRL